MSKTIDSLKKMSRAELLELPTGMFDDYDFVKSGTVFF